MNEQDADKLLRELFQQAGPLQAPEGLDARILQRLAVTPKTAPIPEKPLLPAWAWAAGGLLLAGLVFVPGGSAFTGWMDRLPSFDLDKVLASPWLMMGSVTCAALLGLDAWLNRRRSVQ